MTAKSMGKTFIISSATTNITSGGDQIDTAIFQGARADYTIESLDVVNSLLVRSVAAPEKTVRIQGVDRLQFADSKFSALDANGNAGQAYRLYEAALNRAPDATSLGVQMHALDKGLSLHDLALNFMASVEQRAKFGSLTDADFVTHLYKDVLHRTGDADGLAYWNAQLTAHPGVDARATVVTGFSESAEFRAAIIGTINHGMEYTDVPTVLFV